MISRKILICPLDWGLGHATRDVEIINQLNKAGFDVIIGADKAPLLFLKEQFPDLEYIVIPSTQIRYPKKGSMTIKMLLSAPKILKGIFKEHRLLNRLIQKHNFDIVISDNRYGLWNKKVKSIFITHQLWIKSPKRLRFTEPIINRINHWFINKYDECWIPDFEGKDNLAGELSHPKKRPENIKYIGILSRFKEYIGLTKRQKPYYYSVQYDIVVILSGPEPQRSILEKLLILQISATNYKTLIIQGKPSKKTSYTSTQNIKLVNHLNSYLLREMLIKSKYIICRSGYSSIMDLVILKKNAILIPTPGQTEQEYLAKYLNNKKWFYSVKQSEFDLELAITALKKDISLINFKSKNHLSTLIMNQNINS